jgi:hypothetical protein
MSAIRSPFVERSYGPIGSSCQEEAVRCAIVTRVRLACVASLLAVLITGCAAVTDGTTAAPATPPATSTTTTATSTTTTTTLPAATTTTAPTFQILEIDEVTAARMTYSWHEGCPVGLDQLRLLRLPYHGLDGNIHAGELVANADVADDVVAVFGTLFKAGFPIERMELVDAYQGDDEASMRADNTSGFNCRYVEGTTKWSQHAYGLAIDINPLLNPWVQGETVRPPEATIYTDRTMQVPGMIHDGDVVVEAFSSIGWTWGGTWVFSKDYQHFSASGR